MVIKKKFLPVIICDECGAEKVDVWHDYYCSLCGKDLCKSCAILYDFNRIGNNAESSVQLENDIDDEFAFIAFCPDCFNKMIKKMESVLEARAESIDEEKEDEI